MHGGPLSNKTIARGEVQSALREVKRSATPRHHLVRKPRSFDVLYSTPPLAGESSAQLELVMGNCGKQTVAEIPRSHVAPEWQIEPARSEPRSTGLG